MHYANVYSENEKNPPNQSIFQLYCWHTIGALIFIYIYSERERYLFLEKEEDIFVFSFRIKLINSTLGFTFEYLSKWEIFTFEIIFNNKYKKSELLLFVASSFFLFLSKDMRSS